MLITTPIVNTENHEVVPGTEGRASVRYRPSGEAMHSYIGPWQEANLLYIEQGRLSERLNQPDLEPLVIYDLGLGIGANAIAALECLKNSAHTRSLHIVSFENDMSGLGLGLTRLDLFPFLKPYVSILNILADKGFYSSPDKSFVWELRTGDLLSMPLEGPSPELIFFDFY
ncbi:MAG: tRNA-guanine(34) transglycosylase, partial [Bdellovibrionota bacterium]